MKGVTKRPVKVRIPKRAKRMHHLWKNERSGITFCGDYINSDAHLFKNIKDTMWSDITDLLNADVNTVCVRCLVAFARERLLNEE